MCHSMFITIMQLTSIKKNPGELSVRQLSKLDLAVHKLIKLAEKRETDSSNQTTMKSSRKTYRLEYVRCGKKTLLVQKENFIAHIGMRTGLKTVRRSHNTLVRNFRRVHNILALSPMLLWRLRHKIQVRF